MLRIDVKSTELWDEVNEEFYYVKRQTLSLEHSLVSISKWESKWNKPFLTKEAKSDDETLDYIKCMTLTQNVNPLTYKALTKQDVDRIIEYIGAPMTATTFSEDKTTSKEIITSEIIYYWMVALNIPFECQKWHINRLLTLIKVCNIKNQPPKKMSKREIMDRNRALNDARRRQHNTRG